MLGDLYKGEANPYRPNGTLELMLARLRAFGEAPPTVTNIVPSSGPVSGGSSVTISGASFDEASAVSFGSSAALSYTVNSASSITAVAPPGIVGTQGVAVTTPEGISPPAAADLFTYLATGAPPEITKLSIKKGPAAGGTSVTITAKDHFVYEAPTVTSIAPNTGPKAGATTVTVTGTGFDPGGTVFRFGKGIALEVNCASTATCTMLAPAVSKAGTVDVIATVGKKKSKKSPPNDQFTYY